MQRQQPAPGNNSRVSTHPCNHVGRLAKVGTPLHGIGLGQVILNEAQADVIPHLVQLLVDLGIVAVKVLAELSDNRTVRQRHQLGVDLVNSRPNGVRWVRDKGKEFSCLLPDPGAS